MGIEQDIPATPAGFADPQDSIYTLADMQKQSGVEAIFQEWGNADCMLVDALANAEANLEGACAIAELLMANHRAAVLAPDCAGHFEQLDADLAIGLHAALHQLVSYAKGEQARGRERLLKILTRKS